MDRGRHGRKSLAVVVGLTTLFLVIEPKYAVQTQVMHGFELLTQNEDHDASMVSTQYSFVKWGSAPAGLRRGHGLDVRQLRDPAILQAFESSLD